MSHWTWGNKETDLSNCGGVNVRVSNCEILTDCNWCRPPVNKCEGCEQYAKLTKLYEPPTSVNVHVNSADPAMYDLSGGMSLWNAHFRPTVVPPFGQDHLIVRENSTNNITESFQKRRS